MRIFIGLTDVANVTANYAKGFQALEHETYSVVWSRSYFYPDEKYTLVIDERAPGQKANSLAAYAGMALRLMRLAGALSCDLFIFYAPAVLPTYLYYPLLKALGKKIVTVFWGSDVRYWYAYAEEMHSLGAAEEMKPFFDYARTRSGGSYWDKLRAIKIAERYSDVILSQPDCAQLQTRPYMRTHIPLDLAEYEFRVPARLRPLVLHAPSVAAAKGTDVILKTVEELRNEGLSFDFRLIQKMPNRELRRRLSEADIVVDELYSATVGGLSAEAMASGNAVLVRYMEEYSKVPPACPALNTNVFTLKDNLRRMILDREERVERARRGRPYVEAVNSHVKVCRDILEWLERKDSLEYDFHPTFFQRLRIPKEILAQEKRETTRRRLEFFKTLLSSGSVVKET